MTEKQVFFHELDVDSIFGATVVLDVDGTILCSSGKTVNKEVLEIIEKLSKNNSLYIFSNNFNGKRSREIAESVGVIYIDSPYRKPNKKLLNYIKGDKDNIIVIGDKYLTDYLFAQRIGARHIRVNRYKCKKESLFNKTACLVDDVAYFFVSVFK
ncbi:MAG: HAD-IA family hydrolase [Patescibacteria group bacterium]